MSFKIPDGYELVLKKELPEIQAEGYLLSHRKTKARVCCVETADNNKVFSIAFRTTPTDSTGVAHIIEHTVLCGSDKYPAKDPFVELVKGSLNTFLNAMTYPDKTVYPVASCNMKDFKNLMGVYMDAVFHPNIYKNRMLFEQEGWHYEMEDENGPLIYNGVVYNEMKGAYSSPDDVLGEQIQKALFPDTAYANDSGGYPGDIPNLTYEQFLDFHRRYYHPSNSFIYLYGDCDMTERLEWMDEEYLSCYDELRVDSLVELQKPHEKVVRSTSFYSIGDEESEETNAYLAYTRAVGSGFSMTEDMAYALLDYVLLEAQGACVKQALLDAGIGTDVYGYYDNQCRQPYFAIVAKNARKTDFERFTEIINSTLEKTVKEGISKKSLLAGINNMEFRAKEADYGGYPKGLIYGLDSLNRWLYDDMAAFDTMAFDATYKELKSLIDTDYFERLIESRFLNNTHGADVCLAPKKGYNREMEDALARKLLGIREGLSKDELKSIVEHTRELKKFQDTPSSEEDLKKIPMLEVSDVDRKAQPLYIDERRIGDVPAVVSELFTSGISYINFCFDAHGLDAEDVKYAALLVSFLGNVDTENYSYKDFSQECMIKTGDMKTSMKVYTDKSGCAIVKMEAGMKVLPSQLTDGLKLMEELLLRSRFTDKKRIKELLGQSMAQQSSVIMSRGDTIASCRAASYYSAAAYLSDQQSGVAAYELLEQLNANFDNMADELIERLNRVAAKLISRKNLIIGFTGSGKDYDLFKEACAGFLTALPDIDVENVDWNIKFEAKNEGFKTASQVNYVARCGNYRLIDPNLKYTGALNVLKVWMSYEYMWVNIRVKGGAYGCFAQFLKNGDVRMTSYRDPNLARTSQVFMDSPAAIADMEISKRDLTKYILGAINELDFPMTPARKGEASFGAYLTKTTQEDVQRIRDQVLSVTVKDLRDLAVLIKKALDQGYVCAVGNAASIEADSDLFANVTNIFH